MDKDLLERNLENLWFANKQYLQYFNDIRYVLNDWLIKEIDYQLENEENTKEDKEKLEELKALALKAIKDTDERFKEVKIKSVEDVLSYKLNNKGETKDD